MAYDYNSSQHMKSGIFIAAGIALVFVTTIMIGGDRNFFSKFYDLKVHFDQVQGLAVGSVVTLAGLNVGNVKAIDFSNESQEITVTLSVDLKFKDRITDSSQASIKTQGALGDRYVFIEVGKANERVLNDGEFLLSDKSGDIFDVINKEGARLASVGDVLSELKILLENLNTNGNSGKFLQSIIETSVEAKSFLRESRVLVNELRGPEGQKISRSIVHLNNILEKIDKGQGTLGALVNDPSIHESITNILGKSPRSSYLAPLLRTSLKAKDGKALEK